MNNRSLLRLALVSWVLARTAATFAETPHNLILFVPDGLRSQIVDAATAPTMAQLRKEGVDFQNSHSVFPTFTTANASAFATGHHLGDTGDFSNYIYSGFRVTAAGSTVTPFLEIDPVLRQVNDYYDGNYLNETSIVAAARRQGYATALVGKLGPAAIFDVGALRGEGTLILDDSTGSSASEVPLSAEWLAAFAKAKLAPLAPPRGENGNAGNAATPGTLIPNLAQQQWFLEATIKVVLPGLIATKKPFVLVFWSRDPDGSQHNHGDSFQSLSPGINGPTSLSAIRNADTALETIEQALHAAKIYETTNIVVAADHGFSTISKQSATSPSTKPDTPYAAREVKAGDLPLGFLAIDVFTALQRSDARLKLFDPDDAYKELDWKKGAHPVRGNGVIGADADHPQVVIAANGGSDLIYLPANPPTWGTKPKSPPVAKNAAEAKKLAQRIVSDLLEQDYVSGLFVDAERFGEIPGALSTQSISLGSGHAVTPHPAIVVNFRSSLIPDCKLGPTLCTATIVDSGLQQGQGMHGSFSRSDTWNFMAARGPDFRQAFVDRVPASNADIGMTIAHLLGVKIDPKGELVGRVLTEALSATPASEPLPAVTTPAPLQSKPGGSGKLKTILKTQAVGKHVYLDAAGFEGRTVGLE
jgi:hypothetical protein